jgi:hypothetical protein
MIKSWMLGFGLMLLVACGVEQVTSSGPDQEEAMSAQVAEDGAQNEGPAAPQSDVRISAFTGDAESEADVGTMEACTPGTPGQWCCPYAGGCSCLGYRVCNPSGQWSVCRGAGAAGQPCP